jgi:hypothetical protein
VHFGSRKSKMVKDAEIDLLKHLLTGTSFLLLKQTDFVEIEE